MSESEADRGGEPGADRAKIAGVVGVAPRNEAPDELRRAAGADDDRLVVGGLLERAVNVPLIDRTCHAEFARRELLAPGLFLAREPLQARGIFFSLRPPQ